MESVKGIRKRLNKSKKRWVLNVLSGVFAVLAVLLGVLIYMKKDQNATFLKNNFNINADFTGINASIDKALGSLFTFKLATGNQTQTVSGSVQYLQGDGDGEFSCEGSQIPALSAGVVYFVGMEDDGTYSLLVEYDNTLLVAYYRVSDPLVKTYDQVRKGDYLASYQGSFKALFKKDGRLLTYEEAMQ